MTRHSLLSLLLLLAGSVMVWGCGMNTAAAPKSGAQSKCVGCHRNITPGLVKDHLAGGMGKAGVDCVACHGSEHMDADSSEKAQMPDEQTCGRCHPKRTEQFMGGKHALGWAAMAALPVTAMQPHAAIEGLKGCGGCHKVGVQDPNAPVQSRYGMGCNSCHTRHKFSKAEAQRPQSCSPCHQGASYIQWDAWSKSKHGVIYAIEGDTGRAPTCQTCHMEEGDHGVLTAWGELALLTDKDDPDWARSRAAIFKYLGVYDADGNPTPGLDAVLSAKMLRSSHAQWSDQRDKMIRTCSQCHSGNFAKTHLENTDQLLKEADGMVSQAIETVADLYRRGIIRPGKGQPNFPNLGVLYEARTPIEQDLYRMIIDQRGVLVHGAFHMDPCFVTWEGQAALKQSLLSIRHQAGEMIRQADSR
jgi:hydroxylamine dehydrogenase